MPGLGGVALIQIGPFEVLVLTQDKLAQCPTP
jgi:hypothetical protein